MTCSQRGSRRASAENGPLARVSWECRKMGAAGLKCRAKRAGGPTAAYGLRRGARIGM